MPVCVAAKLRGIKVYLHESDITPGLANRISIRFANRIFTTFKETLDYLPKDKKSLLIGLPSKAGHFKRHNKSCRRLSCFSE